MDYPVTQGGLLVGAWWISIEKAEAYIRRREPCVAQLIDEM